MADKGYMWIAYTVNIRMNAQFSAFYVSMLGNQINYKNNFHDSKLFENNLIILHFIYSFKTATFHQP